MLNEASCQRHPPRRSLGEKSARGGKRPTSRQVAIEAGRIARSKKSKNVVVLDVRRQANYCNYFTLATVETLPQMEAVEKEIVARLKQKGVMRFTSQQLPSREPSPFWRVLDFGGAVVHIMTPQARSFYSLEKIMHRAKKVKNDKRRNKKRN